MKRLGDKHTDMEVFRRRHSAVTRQKRDGTAKHLWDRCGCPFKRQTFSQCVAPYDRCDLSWASPLASGERSVDSLSLLKLEDVSKPTRKKAKQG